MRVSIAWLRELIDLPVEASAGEIAERLTTAGLEVEAVDDLTATYANIVLARITAVQPHPKANKLSVCEVDGGGERLQVVCGAPNVKQGAIAVLALPGAHVAGRAIEPVELRGVASAGMLCSEKELGVGDDQSGILLLDESLVPGTPFCQTLGLDSVVIEVAVTPNRPDALSHIGIARELAALRGIRIKAPPVVPAERGGPIDDAASVTVADTKGCPRYACRVVEGVEIGPSPAWLRQRLQRCGVRSINNVVDITNFVLLERGQPLHAFDADRLGRDRGRAGIVVRRAEPGEKLTTLDGIERALDPEDLLICDPDRPIALAGIMGGAASEVTPRTTAVLIESAYFLPSLIRRAARRHGLHTEASHRFERGCDPNRTLEESLHRAAQLMAELCGGVVRRGVIDVYPKKIEQRVVQFRPARAAAVLGLPPKMVNEAAIGTLFSPLGLEVASRDAEVIHFRIPTWRPDIEREVDLIEEAVRLIGMDKIAETLPRGSGRMARGEPSPIDRVEPLVRESMLAAGFDEAVSLAFVSPREDALCRTAGDLPALAMRNALGEEQSLLRRTLLVRLLAAVGVNQRRGVEDVRLFEIGTVFEGANPDGAAPRLTDRDGPTGGDAFAIERQRVAAVAVGGADPVAFDCAQRAYDF
ncbi:MAG: phenylalanine--tRNA ligase subunit beta, partial [Deltaproteobacteria bacterium]|nr:phenylalanine--tRNA ligase subunit beta [Deltaproteobacteria bacterium]